MLTAHVTVVLLSQEQLEQSKRENTGLLEKERQLQLKLKSLQNCLKNEKEEVLSLALLPQTMLSDSTGSFIVSGV